MFDKSKTHGHVQGDGVAGARFYQDGHYYDVDGKYLFSNPGIGGPPGQKVRTMEQAEADFQARAAAVARGEAPPPSAAPAAATSAPAAPETATEMTREQQLMQFGVPKLQQFMLEALKVMHSDKDEAALKKEVIGGAGAKQKLVKWLLDNTA